MKRVISFENVSKKYRLGVARTSLPSLLSAGVRKIIRPSTSKVSGNELLWALKNVSFNLEQGQSLALVGSNGAGKTTTLKLLAHITQPTTGQIETNGKLSALIELGAGFHPDLTGRENIYLNGTILGLKRHEIYRRFDEIVEFSELQRFIDTPVKRYSSGMIVRLGFAVASCIEPEILLVDEVLAVGDASFRQKSLKRIQDLLSAGTSILFVSHNLYMVQAVCQKSLYLKNGEVQLWDETKKVIEAYESDIHAERARKFSGSAVEKGGSDTGVEITKVDVLGVDGKKTEQFQSNQPAQIRVHYNAYRDMGKVNMSVFVIRSDGMTCCMMRTKLDNYNLNVERGVGTVMVDLEPLQLITGTYFIEAWFLNESDSFGLTPMGGRSDWFAVKGVARSYEETSGVYEPIGRWSHHHNEYMAAFESQTSDEITTSAE
jgi:ABC-2 type transport system ATP-binding protein/lipopolysaccharide transport system ATP-binding protein